MIHELKTLPEYYDKVFMGHKTFEVRINDRNFQTHDHLNLKEWDPTTKKYTGRQLTRRVTYVLHGGQFGIEQGYCIMSIQ